MFWQSQRLKRMPHKLISMVVLQSGMAGLLYKSMLTLISYQLKDPFAALFHKLRVKAHKELEAEFFKRKV